MAMASPAGWWLLVIGGDLFKWSHSVKTVTLRCPSISNPKISGNAKCFEVWSNKSNSRQDPVIIHFPFPPSRLSTGACTVHSGIILPCSRDLALAFSLIAHARQNVLFRCGEICSHNQRISSPISPLHTTTNSRIVERTQTFRPIQNLRKENT